VKILVVVANIQIYAVIFLMIYRVSGKSTPFNWILSRHKRVLYVWTPCI